MSAAMSSRRRANSSSDDRGEDQDREQPGADPPLGDAGILGGGACRRVRAASGDPGTTTPVPRAATAFAPIALASAPSSARTAPRSIVSAASFSVRATTEMPASGSCATARSSPASSPAGSARGERRRAARGASARTAPRPPRPGQPPPPCGRTGDCRRDGGPPARRLRRRPHRGEPDRCRGSRRPGPTARPPPPADPSRVRGPALERARPSRAVGSTPRRPREQAADRPADEPTGSGGRPDRPAAPARSLVPPSDPSPRRHPPTRP